MEDKEINKITIVEGDYWEGLYLNGVLQMEHHRIDLEELIDFIEENQPFKCDFIPANIQWLEYHGNLPENLKDVIKEDQKWSEPL